MARRDVETLVAVERADRRFDVSGREGRAVFVLDLVRVSELF